jgi:APA family basic amino acid/polyamine antiporter
MTGSRPHLARRLGPFDATMIVMGGIVGAGIFINPYVVARVEHTPATILLPWIAGGVIALMGAFVYAELAVWRPAVGGQYVYLRDAFHPVVAFLYGWTLLLVSQTGGMAAVAVTFARYYRDLTGATMPAPWIAVIALAVLVVVNAAGVRTGSAVQSTFMVMKIAALAMLVTLGWMGLHHTAIATDTEPWVRVDRAPVVAFAAAMVPVLFAYGGWQTASFVSGEMRSPTRDLPRALLIGVLGVVVLYVAANAVYVGVLGPNGLAASVTPASAVMERALGPTGKRLIAAGIAISTVGFLSQGMLTAPRVYYAMAQDGLFFRSVGRLNARTQAPVVAIVLQGVLAAVIAVSGKFEQILSYVVAIDAVFFGLTGAALLVFRYRERHGQARPEGSGLRVPGHPVTTVVFVLAFWALAVSTVVQYPRSAGAGMVILVAGLPAYGWWRRTRGSAQRSASEA